MADEPDPFDGIPDMEAVMEDGTRYPNWDALIEAETLGYVVVAIISGGNYKHPWPRVTGIYPDKVSATNAKQRLRTRMRRQQRESTEYEGYTFRLHIEPLWKDPRDRG